MNILQLIALSIEDKAGVRKVPVLIFTMQGRPHVGHLEDNFRSLIADRPDFTLARLAVHENFLHPWVS